MKIKVYTAIDLFLQDFESFLLAEEDANQLILANAYLYLKHGAAKENLFGAILEDEKPVGLFLNAFPYNFQLLMMEEGDKGIRLLVDYLVDHKTILRGINASKEVAVAFMELYQKRTNKPYFLALSMDIMRLDALTRTTVRPLALELATKKDVDELTVDLLAFHRFVFPTQETFNVDEIRIKLLYRIQKKTQFLVRDEQGTIASICHFAERELKNGQIIGGVYTKPEYRKQGYASSLMYQVCEHALNQGAKFVSLFVDQLNPISNHVYLKIGFRIICSNYDYRIKEE